MVQAIDPKIMKNIKNFESNKKAFLGIEKFLSGKNDAKAKVVIEVRVGIDTDSNSGYDLKIGLPAPEILKMLTSEQRDILKKMIRKKFVELPRSAKVSVIRGWLYEIEKSSEDTKQEKLSKLEKLLSAEYKSILFVFKKYLKSTGDWHKLPPEIEFNLPF